MSGRVSGIWVWPQLARRETPRTLGRRHELPSVLSPLQILERLNKMCGVGEQMRKKQQRLLKNMDAHKVMLDLLQIPYDKVTRHHLHPPALFFFLSCTPVFGPLPPPLAPIDLA